MYAIWFLFNKKDTLYLEKIINDLSLDFDSPKFIPHVTVYGVVNLEYAIVEQAVKNSIQKVKPFKVKQIGIKSLKIIWNSLFIDLEKNKELFLINNKLNHSLKEFDKKQFLPHVSLMYKILNKTEKLKTIKKLEIKDNFLIDKIAILKFSEDVSQWKIIRIFNL